MNIFLSSLLYVGVVVLTYMTFLYLLSNILKRSDIVDIGWGLGFIIITLTSLLLTTNITTQMLIITSLVTVWGVRLAIHIYLRNKGKDEDFRYKNFKKKWGKGFWWKSYINIFLLQGFLMILISIPIIYRFTYPTQPLTVLDYVGIAVWLFGFLFELISDFQLSKFIKQKKEGNTKGRFLKSGLWSLSRHPNYFGEVVLWWGIWLLAIDLSSPYSLLTIIGPLTITYFIIKVSGVPLLEEKYMGNEEWEEYKKEVPIFVPLRLK
jgi:steroid 5-alpha reductase family enzyme